MTDKPSAGPVSARIGSDLWVRLTSALVMIVVAGAALILGGLWLRLFVLVVAIGLFWEFRSLVRRFARSRASYAVWMLGGALYIGLACFSLLHTMDGVLRWLIIAAVIATDSGAYFAGRTFGGAKIAPAISPSKTWAGLYGGMAGASLVLLLGHYYVEGADLSLRGGVLVVLAGCILAIVAQAGDFFESWMKRKAGAKDSGKLIPGHGGLFDRVDGLLSVSLVVGFASWVGLL